MEKWILYLIFLINSISFSQIVYIPVNNDIYDYLEEINAKGIININNVAKPFSRKYISSLLNEALNKSSELTKIEREELVFYSKEYSYELKKIKNELNKSSITYFNFDNFNRFRFLSYYDSIFTINAEPILGYDIKSTRKENISHRINGLDLYGYFNDYIGYHLRFYDNNESGGNYIDQTRDFTELTGFSFISGGNKSIDYDDVCAALTYNWSWGDISIAKDYVKWGSGQAGQVILSDKAPSFPMIRLNLSPVNWLNFTYIYGYLNSGVIDSSTLRHNINKERVHYGMVPKYYAAHLLTIQPFQFANISLGESIILSDKFEPIYLIPFIFFRMADHNNAEDQMTSGNAQLFGDLSIKIPQIRSKIYSTLFIDELSLSDLNLPKDIAYTVGFQVYDPIIKDIEFTVEYTRIDPFVYYHADDAQGYSNYGYQLGHWIGSNGDQIYFSSGKKIIRGLKISAYWEYIRKGQKESHNEPRNEPWQTFRYGLKTNYAFWGVNLHYEIIHSLFAKLEYKNSSIDHEQNDHSYISERYNDLAIGLSYGF